MSTDDQNKIRQLAHQIWEDEGRPEGREDEHWLRAEEMVAAARATKASPKAKTPAKAKAPAKPKAPAKKKA
ncbi:MAG: DUF2934 domain-containing protein [Alphaproteobacteria bacterium]|nr:DUF2934 domain-containing protein [Alphaproteobacteria bacterium]